MGHQHRRPLGLATRRRQQDRWSRATLIHQPPHDPGLRSLVAQGLAQVGAAPSRNQRFGTRPASWLVMPLRRPRPGPDLVVDGAGDHLLGRLMLA